jgi:hypothetical protein
VEPQEIIGERVKLLASAARRDDPTQVDVPAGSIGGVFVEVSITLGPGESPPDHPRRVRGSDVAVRRGETPDVVA